MNQTGTTAVWLIVLGVSCVLPLRAESAVAYIRRPAGSAPYTPGGEIETATFGEDGQPIVRPLVRQFHSVADLSLSRSGDALFFSAKESPEQRWNIWRVALQDGALTQVTRELGNCVSPVPLKGEILVFASDVDGAGEGPPVPRALYARFTDGSIQRVTYGPGEYHSPACLHDNRIVYVYVDRGFHGTGERRCVLQSIRWDGTGMCFYASVPDPSAWVGGLTLMRNGDLLYLTGETPRQGRPLIVDYRRPIMPAKPLGDRGHRWMGADQLPDGSWVVSARGEGGPAGLYHVRSDPLQQRPVVTDPELDYLQPVSLVPKEYGALHATNVKPALSAGELVALNLYDERVTADRIEPGTGRSVRVFAGDRGEDDGMRPLLLGESPVEEDGSFYIRVPADRTLTLSLVDSEGELLRAFGQWFWVRPNEPRVFHGFSFESRFSPKNQVPLALTHGNRPEPVGVELVEPAPAPASCGGCHER